MPLSRSSPTVQLINRTTGTTSDPATVTGNVAEFAPAPAGRWDGILVNGAYRPMTDGLPLFITDTPTVLTFDLGKDRPYIEIGFEDCTLDDLGLDPADGLVELLQSSYARFGWTTERLEAAVDAVLRYRDRIQWSRYHARIDLPPEDAHRYAIIWDTTEGDR